MDGQDFQILGRIRDIAVIAVGTGIRDLTRLRRVYGRGRWRKRKGIARIRLADGATCLAEYTGTKRLASAVGN